MKVSERLDVTAEAFFASVVNSVRYDIEQATGDKVAAADIVAGYSYKKSLRAKAGGSRAVTATIVELEAPRVYEASFTSGEGVNTVRYEVTPAEGGSSIDVVYEEGFTGNKAMSDLNGKIMGSLYSWTAKRRIKKRLHQMEAYLQSHPATGDAGSAIAEESEE